MTTIDKPKVPKIPEPPLGVSREILGDPCGGDGGGRSMLRAWKEDQRGVSRRNMARRMTERGAEGRTGHARNAAEEPEVWRRNTRDGTWRRSGGPQPVPVSQGSIWRPWAAQEETEESLQTVVSIANPDNFNHPVYYTSTDVRTRSQLQQGELICNHQSSFNVSLPRLIGGWKS